MFPIMIAVGAVEVAVWETPSDATHAIYTVFEPDGAELGPAAGTDDASTEPFRLSLRARRLSR